MYFAYVRSILEYCSPIWNPQYVTHEHHIERIQNKFLKYLNYRCRLTCNNDYEDSCQRHGLMTLKNRRVLMDMSLLHDVCSGALDCPSLVTEMVRLTAGTKRTRHTKLFSVPRSNTNYFSNCVYHRLPNTYNMHFQEVDPFSMSKTTFKHKISEVIKNMTK